MTTTSEAGRRWVDKGARWGDLLGVLHSPHSGLTPNGRRLYTALVWRADGATARGSRSMAALADDCGWGNRRTVQRTFAELEAAGLVARKDVLYGSTRYVLDVGALERLAQRVRDAERGGVTPCHTVTPGHSVTVGHTGGECDTQSHCDTESRECDTQSRECDTVSHDPVFSPGSSPENAPPTPPLGGAGAAAPGGDGASAPEQSSRAGAPEQSSPSSHSPTVHGSPSPELPAQRRLPLLSTVRPPSGPAPLPSPIGGPAVHGSPSSQSSSQSPAPSRSRRGRGAPPDPTPEPRLPSDWNSAELAAWLRWDTVRRQAKGRDAWTAAARAAALERLCSARRQGHDIAAVLTEAAEAGWRKLEIPTERRAGAGRRGSGYDPNPPARREQPSHAALAQDAARYTRDSVQSVGDCIESREGTWRVDAQGFVACAKEYAALAGREAEAALAAGEPGAAEAQAAAAEARRLASGAAAALRAAAAEVPTATRSADVAEALEALEQVRIAVRYVETEPTSSEAPNALRVADEAAERALAAANRACLAHDPASAEASGAASRARGLVTDASVALRRGAAAQEAAG